jgi:cytoskeleton protein RodZ
LGLYSDKDAMGDLGERLRRERESKGISLDEIARQTRIGVRLLKAIEEEAFDQLPGGIFNKSFIQQYSRCLGLDEKQAGRDYQRMTVSARETPFPQPVSTSRSLSSAAPQAIIRLALGGAAIILIILVIWWMLPRPEIQADSQRTVTESPASSESEEAEVAPMSGPDSISVPSAPKLSATTRDPDGATVSNVSETVPAPEAASPVPKASNPVSAAELLTADGDHEPLAGELPEELLLQINARSTVWISITADGEKQWQGTLKPNQSREVQAADTIRLTVGNAGGVELTLNGKNLGAIGREGEVKTVTLAARALQDVVP